MKIDWKRAVDFAEMAETLGIRTTQIMAARIDDPEMIVVYTPELDEDDLDPGTPLYIARLARDADRILMVVGEPVLTEFAWNDIEAEVARRLEGES